MPLWIIVFLFHICSLTDNFDSDAGCGLTSLILQNYLIVACVFSLCDLNCEACLVAMRFSSDTVAWIKNHLK